MALLKKEDYIFYSGNIFQVEFYFTEKGGIPAKEIFDAAPLFVKVKLAALIKYIADNGRLFDKTKFRIIDPAEKIYEFKPANYRFFSFFYKEGKIIITNGYIKKSQKVSRQDLKQAISIRKDYLTRNMEERYYEKQ